MRTPPAAGWRLGRLQQPRGGKLTKRIATNNVRIALLCAFVTLLVLRGTVGVNRRLVYIAASDGAAAHAARGGAVEGIERVLREIRADSDDDTDPDDAEGGSAAARYYDHGSAWSTSSYRLGPRVTRWNAKRRRWLHQNPGFPPRDARGNPRVLLATASPPGPCDDDHFLLRATKNKIDYCRLHGIELAHGMAEPDRALSGAGGWGKLARLRRLMLAHPEVEWLWWVDGDALITDMGFELPLARYEGSHLVVHGNSYLLFQLRSWAAVGTGSFLLRNCQWSLELLDAWAVMAPRGRARDDAGELLTAALYGRPAREADHQSALVHLLLTETERWMGKVYLENEYYLHGHWAGLVDTYEEAMEKHHPGYGDHRWPFVTHFAGCTPCAGGGGANSSTGEPEDIDKKRERCLRGMERAFNFADNQVLRLYGFRHESLASAEVRRVENRSVNPLEAKEEAIAFLKKPKEPPRWNEDVRKNRKLKAERSSVLARILRRLGWRSKF
ncbi:hypothetical protein BS78_05G049900 [Paspalum vaginatum]|nr:hypothetical protein BS78_05G049900 [Paspalum vaginatum]